MSICYDTETVIHTHTAIPLIVRAVAELQDSCMTITFERPPGFTFDAGDWIDLGFPGGNPKGGVTYSLSSSPTESHLAITFRHGISPFKQRLQNLQTGDKLFITQYGNDYDFHLKDNRSSVLIAGGIGIAPFRSMLKEMADTNNPNTVQLIYLNKSEPFVFTHEINAWQQTLPALTVTYVTTESLNRKKREKLLINHIDLNAHHFFIAGPETMVESTEHLLVENGIRPKDIRIDSFGGY
jgi:ferredoxin-NADP reductase